MSCRGVVNGDSFGSSRVEATKIMFSQVYCLSYVRILGCRSIEQKRQDSENLTRPLARSQLEREVEAAEVSRVRMRLPPSTDGCV